jgi:hypothetical protein
MAGGVRPLDRRADVRPGARFEKVEPGDEQVLPERDQRDLDGVPSFLALRDVRNEPETP